MCSRVMVRRWFKIAKGKNDLKSAAEWGTFSDWVLGGCAAFQFKGCSPFQGLTGRSKRPAEFLPEDITKNSDSHAQPCSHSYTTMLLSSLLEMQTSHCSVSTTVTNEIIFTERCRWIALSWLFLLPLCPELRSLRRVTVAVNTMPRTRSWTCCT